MRGAVFFDVDGTLVFQTSSSQHLASYLGHAETLRDFEDAYATKGMHNSEVAVHDSLAYAGVTATDLHPWLRELPLVAGIQQVVDWCQEHDLVTYLATLAWEPVGHYLCETFGFAGSCGPSLAHVDGTYTGEVSAHFTEFDKRDFALQTAMRLGLDMSDCAAVGDSRSDLPLFREVGFSVGFNADQAVQAIATVSVGGPDLGAVVGPLEAWLNSR